MWNIFFPDVSTRRTNPPVPPIISATKSGNESVLNTNGGKTSIYRQHGTFKTGSKLFSLIWWWCEGKLAVGGSGLPVLPTFLILECTLTEHSIRNTPTCTYYCRNSISQSSGSRLKSSRWRSVASGWCWVCLKLLISWFLVFSQTGVKNKKHPVRNT